MKLTTVFEYRDIEEGEDKVRSALASLTDSKRSLRTCWRIYQTFEDPSKQLAPLGQQRRNANTWLGQLLYSKQSYTVSGGTGLASKRRLRYVRAPPMLIAGDGPKWRFYPRTRGSYQCAGEFPGSLCTLTVGKVPQVPYCL